MNNTIKRCAIYCRKSHEEGLDMEFNSLDAQREAIRAYIFTQRLNGWAVLPKTYEDGGYSGSNTDRPGLQELLKDIDDGKVDIVLVYKIDRLSRSLIDFTNLFAKFEEKGVSFVSVTQQIDTSTPAGRMMLNILMTFAQYEREVIAERIRDKMSASRKKGIWMGGAVPVGYKIENKKLIPDEEQVAIVRWIFNRYSEVGSISAIVKELNDAKLTPSINTTWKYARVMKLLHNPVYIGKAAYKGSVYDGEHEAIIDLGLWERVQAMGKHVFAPTARYSQGSHAPLKGIIRCGHCGCAMVPAFSTRKNKHYHYYVCNHYKTRVNAQCPVGRVAGGDIEVIVFQKLTEVLKSDTFYELLLKSGIKGWTINASLKNVSKLWDELFPIERTRLIQLLFANVTLSATSIDFELKTSGMNMLIQEIKDGNN